MFWFWYVFGCFGCVVVGCYFCGWYVVDGVWCDFVGDVVWFGI